MIQQDEQLCALSKARQELRQTVEAWYVWMSSTPHVLFHSEDQQRMQAPVSRLDQLTRWQSESAHAKHAWFLENGIPLLRRRLDKGDYDRYES